MVVSDVDILQTEKGTDRGEEQLQDWEPVLEEVLVCSFAVAGSEVKQKEALEHVLQEEEGHDLQEGEHDLSGKLVCLLAVFEPEKEQGALTCDWREEV